MAAELPGQCDSLARRLDAGDTELAALTSEVKQLRSQLAKAERMQALAASTAVTASLNSTQRTQVCCV